MFYAPSDLSGIGGMHRERIRAVPSWHRGPPQYDCVFAEADPNRLGFQGLLVGRVRLFFSFKTAGQEYPCALLQWFSTVGDEADDDTGMWIVEPDFDISGVRACEVVHVDTLMRSAHLIPVYDNATLPSDFHHFQSLDSFWVFFVNKFADRHAHEVAF